MLAGDEQVRVAVEGREQVARRDRSARRRGLAAEAHHGGARLGPALDPVGSAVVVLAREHAVGHVAAIGAYRP